MRPHKLWRMDRLICFLAQTLMFFFSFFRGAGAVSSPGRLIMKPPSLLDSSTLMFRGLVGNRGTIVHFAWDNMPKEHVDGSAVMLIYADNELLKYVECSAISGLSS